MKKSFAIIALAALVMLASCKKDEQQPTGTKLRAGIEQQKNDGKTSLNPNDLTISWTAGDQLYVNNGSEAAQFTLTSGAGTATGEFATTGDYTFASANNVAVYPYNENIALNGTTLTMTLPATQTASAAGTFGNGANPMLAKFANNEDITLASLCGALCLQLTGADVDITAIEIVGGPDDKLNGTFTVDYTMATPALAKSGDDGTNKVTLNLTETVTLNSTTAQKFFVVLPAGALANGFTMNVKNGDNVVFTKSTANDITILANYVETMAEMTVTTTPPTPPAPEGAVDGLFSVSPTLKVYFSQGNLQFKAAGSYVDPTSGDIKGGTWRFAEHQWDFVGGLCTSDNNQYGNVYEGGVKCDNSLVASDYTGWIDLFAWGTSGYNHGATNYQPWASTSYDNNNYNVYNSVTASLFDGNGRADWGYNAITNGGNTENSGWRTLKTEEWQYVIGLVKNSTTGGYDVTGRIADGKTAEGLSLAFATVNGVKGMILLPDNWTTATYALNNVNEVTYAAYTSNVIDAATWAASLEANGAVFLPITGYRVFGGYRCLNTDEQSCYQASTHEYYLAWDFPSSYTMEFRKNWDGDLDLYPSIDGNRYYAYPVRLARDAQ